MVVRVKIDGMPAKTEQLQIRLSAQEKALLRRRAAAAGQDISAYVLSRALPPASVLFAELMASLGTDDLSYALAGLNDLLSGLAATEFTEAVGSAELTGLSAFAANYAAALVEHAAGQKGVRPPAWTRQVMPLEQPWFAAQLPTLRLHLLRKGLVAFKRRNLFVDASIGARV